jgi:hypothetical protein
MLPPSLGWKAESEYSPEMLVRTYQTSRCRNSGSQNINLHPVKPQALDSYFRTFSSHKATALAQSLW